jgi:plasmid stabilization system protein ParE
LRNKSTLYAERLLRLIKSRIKTIVNNPNTGKPTSYLNTREAAMGNFSIYYKTTSQHIIITAFWDNRQDPEKIINLIKK